MLVPISGTSTPPTTNPAMVPSRPRTTFWPVLSALERSTESVPNTTQKQCCTPVRSATSTARPSAGRAAEAVVQPDRVRSTCAGALLRGGQRPREARRLAAEQPVDQPRRSAAAAKSMLLAICETAKLSSCARKLGSSELIAGARSPSALDGQLAWSSALSSHLRAARRARRRALPRMPPALRAGRRRARARAAATLTAQAAVRGVASPAGARLHDRVEPASSSTSRTTARVEVLSPVGR